jgi:hypothetical protein
VTDFEFTHSRSASPIDLSPTGARKTLSNSQQDKNSQPAGTLQAVNPLYVASHFRGIY